MFDTMTMTKAVGALCGTFLAFLLIGFAGETIYAPAYGGGGEHGGEHAQAYVIEVAGADESGSEGEAEAVDFDALLAAADAAAGEKVFGKCKACHKLDGSDGTGPHLNGVVGRAKAASPGFAYSEVLAGMAGDSWTPANLNGFLENPKGYAPGTKMSFAGLPKAEDRANVIAYLTSVP
jgi:cytochrome c